MEIRLFHGYKMKALTSFEMMEFVNILREDLAKFQKAKFQQTYASRMVHLIDNLTYLKYKLENEKENKKDIEQRVYECLLEVNNMYNKVYENEICLLLNKNMLSTLKEKSLKELIEALNQENATIKQLAYKYMRNQAFALENSEDLIVPFDYRAKIVFFPINEEETLMLLYGTDLLNYIETVMQSKNDYDKNFKEYFGLEYYGYWNGLAKPTKCQEEDWKVRQEKWEQAIPFMEVPENSGIVVEIMTNDLFYNHICKTYMNDLDAIFEYIEDKETRVKKTAKQYCKTDFFNQKKIEEKNKWKDSSEYKFLDEKNKEWNELIKNKDETIINKMEEQTKICNNYIIDICKDNINQTAISVLNL